MKIIHLLRLAAVAILKWKSKKKKKQTNKVTAKTFLFIRKVFCAVIFALNKTRYSKKIV